MIRVKTCRNGLTVHVGDVFCCNLPYNNPLAVVEYALWFVRTGHATDGESLRRELRRKFGKEEGK